MALYYIYLLYLLLYLGLNFPPYSVHVLNCKALELKINILKKKNNEAIWATVEIS